jgi:uncharacterized cupin superfamily protein
MDDPNLFRPSWDRDLPDPPFGSRGAMLAAHAGARELGATLYELDPGGRAAPYHVHHGNEELLLVLEGRPTLRTPEGERVLEPGAVVAFPRGPGGAHGLHNAGEERARYLIVSTMHMPEVAEHPDTGTTLAMTGPGEGWTFPKGSDVPFMEAVARAVTAAAEREG